MKESINSYDAIVVGAGLAGLSAAFEFAERGLRVLLLERDPQVGGRTSSWKVDGMNVESGIHKFVGFYKNYEKFLKRVGLDLDDVFIYQDEIEIRVRGYSLAMRKNEAAAIEVPIKKPSFSYSNAMRLPGPSAAVTGQLDGDTADVVRLDAKAGETWEITLLSSRAGSLLDPILRIRDSHHTPLALSTGDKKKDRRITFRVPTDGAYFVEITEAEARGGAGYNYRLAVLRKP